MTPDDLDAIVARAASVYPEDAGWDGDEAERALTTVTQHVPALAAALRGAWRERDILNDARNVLTDAVATLTQERDEWKHVAEQRDVDGAALASRLRADKAEQRQRAERAEHERDAALAAVDAVRAELARKETDACVAHAAYVAAANERDDLLARTEQLAALVARGGDRG